MTLATSHCVHAHSGVFIHSLVFINIVHYDHFCTVKARFQVTNTELEVYVVQQMLYNCYRVLNKERGTNCDFKTFKYTE